ncbi:MAG TPA: C-terminal binding protein [Abditibacteriaceae bacterium]
MAQWKAVVTDHGFKNIEQERRILEEAGCELSVAQCKTQEEVIQAARGAHALLVQWAPITAEVIESLDTCKIIVRYGIGVDNVALEAAKAKGITVCNVPDYCIDEVADHSVALALSLGRQLTQIDRRLRDGVWKIVPDSPMPAFREMTFATAGFGRIARAVLERARPFGFRLAAYDPFVEASEFKNLGVQQLSLDELFTQADILSLHLPLTPQTQHLVNAERLGTMKSHAVVVNTARGPLIDTVALAQALSEKQIAFAGLDVFDPEPLPDDHPLRGCDNALLTSHVAWYSESSVPKLQRMVAEEAVRGLRGEAVRNQVNR